MHEPRRPDGIEHRHVHQAHGTRLHASALIVMVMPSGNLPERFGLKNERVPEGFLGQMAYPFRRARESG